MSVTWACFWHCHSGRAPSFTPPLAVGSAGTTKKLWGLHGSYSYIVNTSSCNPCSENNQIFRLSNCFSCLVTSSPTNVCLWECLDCPVTHSMRVCVFSFFPCVDHSFLSPRKLVHQLLWFGIAFYFFFNKIAFLCYKKPPKQNLEVQTRGIDGLLESWDVCTCHRNDGLILN